MQSEIITDHSPAAFERALDEIRPVVARVFDLDDSALARLDRILSRPSLFRRVAVLYRQDGVCVGYQLMMFEQLTVDGRKVGICRPLVGFVEGVRGSRRAFVDSIPVTLRVRLESRLPLYMVSVAATPMGYRLAACSTRQAVPSPRPHANDADTLRVLEQTLSAWGLTTQDRDGVMVARNVRCRVPYRPDATDAEGAFFLSHCPDFAEGMGLPVCTPLSLPVLAEVGLLTLRRQLGLRPTRTLTAQTA